MNSVLQKLPMKLIKNCKVKIDRTSSRLTWFVGPWLFWVVQSNSSRKKQPFSVLLFRKTASQMS